MIYADDRIEPLQRTIESQAARIAAALALHQRCDAGEACPACPHNRPTCIACDFLYPCPTRRALTEDTP